jgi:hypothetical protein
MKTRRSNPQAKGTRSDGEFETIEVPTLGPLFLEMTGNQSMMFNGPIAGSIHGVKSGRLLWLNRRVNHRKVPTGSFFCLSSLS